MKECKNVECKIPVVGNKLYCSLKCRNVYVNKYLRDYSKTSQGFKDKKNELELKYYENPKHCLECSKILSYEVRKNKFCNHSCSAKETNKLMKGMVKNFSEEGVSNIRKGIEERHGKKIKISKCLYCNTIIKRKRYCNKNCRILNTHKDEKKLYRVLCKFNFSLNEYPDYFDFDLIKKYGWYKAKNHGDNPLGVSRDHLYSINEGFKNNVLPWVISHPANCGLKQQVENIKKYTKSEITLDELIEKIKNF